MYFFLISFQSLFNYNNQINDNPEKDKEINDKKMNEKAPETSTTTTTKVQNDASTKVDEFVSPREEKSKSAYKTAKITIKDDPVSLKQQQRANEKSKNTIITRKFPKSKKIGQPKPFGGEQRKIVVVDKMVETSGIISKENSQIPEMSKKQPIKSDKDKPMEIMGKNPEDISKEQCKE